MTRSDLFNPMIDPARLWPCLFGSLTIVGVVAALVSLPIGAMAALAIGFALSGPLLYCSYRNEYRPGTQWALPKLDAHQLVRGGFLTGAAAVAATGYVTMTGPVGLLVPVIALAASPIGLVRPGPASALAPEVERLGPPPTEPLMGRAVRTSVRTTAATQRSWSSFDDDSLCRAWRTSFTALQRRAPHDDPTVLIETRRQLLDELARRDPAGFDRWLAAGARAASNPHRFLTSTQTAARSRPQRPTGQADGAGQ